MAIINIAPGEVAIGQDQDELRTLLGSCVSIVLWNPQHKTGAMTHIVLPARKKPSLHLESDDRFADEAWQTLVRKLGTRGISPQDCICKIFGGSQVFDDESASVGKRNLASVRQLLNQHGVSITSEHVAGKGYRELRFSIHTGEVWVRHIQKTVAAIAATRKDD